MSNVAALRKDLIRIREIDRTNELASLIGTSLCLVGLAIAAASMAVVVLM